MKRITLILMAVIAILSFTSCTENYSNGTRVGTITQFSRTGNFCKSYEGHLNVTQTGMNSAAGFDFSIDNDNEPVGLSSVLDSSMNYGWKVELKYHQVSAMKNWFNNRGHTDYFVNSCKVLDRGFNTIFSTNTNKSTNSSINSVLQKDTIIHINVSLSEDRKAGWIK